MIPQWVIEKKRDGQALTREDIEFFIRGYTDGSIPDYQMSALAMAILWRGMDPLETGELTRAMLRSGDVIDPASIPGLKVDKHSTGGIGDKTSLILAPLLAACGLHVPMLSGRGLGLTGGTLDKLESIPGFRTNLSEEEFLRVVRECGCCMAGQTERLVPADRKLYALRDVTATVPSIPLITASIMSKKLAEGIDALVLDVKCGRGAFMRTREDARRLAASLVATGRSMNKKISALITDMNIPLGRAAGNALEVMESVECLEGRGPDDLRDLTLALGAELLVLAGRAPTTEAAWTMQQEQMANGAAMKEFLRMVELQGGNPEALRDYNLLPCAPVQQPLSAPRDAWVADVDAERIGRAVLLLGAGRTRSDQPINPAVGVSDLAQPGEQVKKGQVIATVHAAAEPPAEAMKWLREAFVFSDTPVNAPPRILERLRGSDSEEYVP
ncbi:MAG: thymidine phosphorylase [Kiritimatiellae bacterium]|nr:thymidine phosphorylase [Kiritimatiellia bacterium]